MPPIRSGSDCGGNKKECVKKMRKMRRALGVLLAVCLCFTVIACSGKKDESKSGKEDEVEVQLFVAASLTQAISEITEEFEKGNPGVKVSVNADSSGKLKTQIEEGFDCNLFFSASENEMAELGDKGLIDKESVKNVLGNKLAIVTYKDYEGNVKGLHTLNEAESIALPYGSVPAGFYARKAMIANGNMEGSNLEKEEIQALEGSKIAEALGGLTISEQSNVSTVISAVSEKSCEIGFAYTSDIYRNKDIKVIEEISSDLTGEILYPLVKVRSDKASEDLKNAADKLYDFLMSDFSKSKYEEYGFSFIQ